MRIGGKMNRGLLLNLLLTFLLILGSRSEDEIIEEVDEEEEDGGEQKFEDCYINTIELMREELGVLRVCIIMEDFPIKKDFCKRIINCAEKLVSDESPIKRTEVDQGFRSGRDRLDDFNQEHHKMTDQEFRETVQNTFAFLFEAGCYKDTPEKFQNDLEHYVYWVIQQVEMQKCFSTRFKSKLDKNKFKIWHRRMENMGRFEYEMDFIKSFLKFHKIDNSWPPKFGLEPMIYTKIIKADEGRPLGTARYAFIFDREKLYYDDEAQQQSFRRALSVVVKLFDCWDEGNEECEYWESNVDKPFIKGGVDMITESEYKIFQDLHKYIPEPDEDGKNKDLLARTKRKKHILRFFDKEVPQEDEVEEGEEEEEEEYDDEDYRDREEL